MSTHNPYHPSYIPSISVANGRVEVIVSSVGRMRREEVGEPYSDGPIPS